MRRIFTYSALRWLATVAIVVLFLVVFILTKHSAGAPKKPLIAISMCNNQPGRWMREGGLLRKNLEGAGCPTFLSFDPTISEQKQTIRRAIEKKAAVLIIAPLDAEALNEELNRAAAAGIKIIAYDRLLRNTQSVDY